MDKVEYIKDLLLTYAPKAAGAIIALLIGFWIIGVAVRGVDRVMKKKEMDESLRPFLKKLLSISLKIMLLISVASMAGIEVTSFITLLGTAGLAIGLALQGSLSNFAGGVLILILKPFKVGDVIELQGYIASVYQIQIFHTILRTAQGQYIYIPNSSVSNSSIKNYTVDATRRLDLLFGISYFSDIDHAKAVLKRIIDSEERILKDPAPGILVEALSDSSVDIRLKLWVANDHFWPVHYFMHEAVKKEFDKENISIPFPHIESYVHQVKD